MTFKEYKAIYGKDGYCSLNELENIREDSNPRSYKAILAHWEKAHFREMDRLSKECF